MMRLTLSLVTIAAMFTMGIAATGALFSESRVIEDNYFTTGSVDLGNVSGLPLSVTNLIPGESQTKTMGYKYTGTTPADIYLGNTGNSNLPNDRIADELRVTITPQGEPGTIIFDGYADELVTAWAELDTDVGFGWHYYEVTFTLDIDVGNDFQNLENTNTVILLYAVQGDGGAPSLPPIDQPLTGDFN